MLDLSRTTNLIHIHTHGSTGTVGVMEELEESQMRLQQMLAQRHVAPFRMEAQVIGFE